MPNKWSKYLELKRFNNLAEMILSSVDKWGDKIVMRWFGNKELTVINTCTYNQLGETMKNCFGALRTLGYKKNNHIAVCSETRPEWVYADLGNQALGGVTVAIYASLKSKEIQYILNDSESELIFVDEEETLEKVLKAWENCPKLKHIVVFEEFKDSLKKENVYSLKEFLESGVKYCKDNPEAFDQSVSAIKEEDLCSIIYTSGTTGIPKGAMLTNLNFLSDVTMAVAVTATMRPKEVPSEIDFLTIMPMSHSFGRCTDEYCVPYVGASMNFAGGFEPARVRKAIEDFHPRMIVGIPYLFERMYKMILEEVESMPSLLQKEFHRGVKLGLKYYQNKVDDIKNPLFLSIRYKVLGGVLARILRKKLGGRLKYMLSGSAAISPKLALFFFACGFECVEGYGLTETSPVTHVLRSEKNSDFRPNIPPGTPQIQPYTKLGKVGPLIHMPEDINPYPNPTHKLSETGELLLKGPQVFQGYWKKPDLTAAAFTKDGWFRTGDLAEIDEDEYVKIVGRSKLVIKLSTGKMISPSAVEGLVVPTSDIIAQFVLVGNDSRKYLTSIVVPYQQPLKEYADKNGIKYENWEDLARNKEIQKIIKEEILSLTADVSDYARPKKFALSSKAFDAEEEYLTPSYKFKRTKLFADLDREIDKMYASDDNFHIIEDRMTDFYDQSQIIG